ncbi:transposable element Tcb2 transposase [Trichonephila clavipes]|nr:transposable element Tcb2 transposase [Trichonephila clavipes]
MSSLATNLNSISAVLTIVFVSLVTVGVKVWGGIAYNTGSPVVLIRGTMTTQRYVHDILQTHVLPLMQRLPEAIFQQDNARPHTARVSLDFLRIVTTLSCPARSPDLSLIEHIWDHLGRIEWVPQGQTIKQQYYVEDLRKLRERVRKKRTKMQSNKWILQQDNAPMHIALSVKQFLAN